MRGFLIFMLLLIGAVISIELLYRWSNDLELSWSWLGYRAGMLAVIILMNSLILWRERRRGLSGGKQGGGILSAIVALLMGGALLGVFGWRVVDALWTGQVVISTTPDTYTAWSANPLGFAMAVGFHVLATAFALLLFAGGIYLMGDYFSRRSGPARG